MARARACAHISAASGIGRVGGRRRFDPVERRSRKPSRSGRLRALAQRLGTRSTGRWWSRVRRGKPPLVAGPGDLRGARRSRARAPGPQQPRDVRLLRRPLGRRDRALSPRAGDAVSAPGRPADVAYTDCNIGEILSDQGHLEEAGTTCDARVASGARPASVRRSPLSTCSWRGSRRAGVIATRRCPCSRRRGRACASSTSTPTRTSRGPSRRGGGAGSATPARAVDIADRALEADDRSARCSSGSPGSRWPVSGCRTARGPS